MSYVSINKDFEPLDIDFHDIDYDEDNIMRLKANLIINNIKRPNFDYYKILKKRNPENEILSDFAEKKNMSLEAETISRIDDKEQINEVKVNLFFILYNGCDYNDEYKEVIIDRYIKTKRLIIQDYSIKDDKIELGKKQYRYIKIVNKNDNLCFNDELDEIIVDQKKDKKDTKKEIRMRLNGKKLLSENEFTDQHKNITNIKDDLILLNSKSGKKSLSVKNKKIKMDDISSKEGINIIEFNTISKHSNDNLTNSSVSKELDDSEKEVKGERFYSENKRYIFIDLYSKEIDGIFTIHNKIYLGEAKKDLKKGLEDLLSAEKKNKIINDIQSHIIYKNFDDPYINENIPFILEIKKSMNFLISLLNQIKNISKVSGNLCDAQIPTTIIGIICRFSPQQIIEQQNFLTLKKENETLLDHIINIINRNKVRVVIGAIEDEKILDYPLGESDYNIEGANLKTRIDIFYMNNRFKNLDDKVMTKIHTKYSQIYKSITFLPNSMQNFEYLFNKNKELELKLEKEKKKIEELKLKLKEKDEKIKELENQLKYGKHNKDNEKGDEKNSNIKKDN